jgi:hypothetical protein
MVRQAIEGQIGMLTCQVIELSVQLQLAHQEIGQLRQTLANAEDRTAVAEDRFAPPAHASPSSPMQNGLSPT